MCFDQKSITLSLSCPDTMSLFLLFVITWSNDGSPSKARHSTSCSPLGLSREIRTNPLLCLQLQVSPVSMIFNTPSHDISSLRPVFSLSRFLDVSLWELRNRLMTIHVYTLFSFIPLSWVTLRKPLYIFLSVLQCVKLGPFGMKTFYNTCRCVGLDVT